jgi:YD repeat-containing protein
MKTYFISLLLLLIASTSLVGQAIAFDYDADGNLKSRHLTILKSSVQNTEEETTDIVAIEFSDRKITVYPNPTKERISIEIAPLATEQKNFLRLYDASGKLLKTLTIESVQTELEITGNPGIYLLNIHLGEEVSKWKIIKQ